MPVTQAFALSTNQFRRKCRFTFSHGYAAMPPANCISQIPKTLIFRRNTCSGNVPACLGRPFRHGRVVKAIGRSDREFPEDRDVPAPRPLSPAHRHHTLLFLQNRFRRQCRFKSCHGYDGKGMEGPDLHPPNQPLPGTKAPNRKPEAQPEARDALSPKPTAGVWGLAPRWKG